MREWRRIAPGKPMRTAVIESLAAGSGQIGTKPVYVAGPGSLLIEFSRADWRTHRWIIRGKGRSNCHTLGVEVLRANIRARGGRIGRSTIDVGLRRYAATVSSISCFSIERRESRIPSGGRSSQEASSEISAGGTFDRKYRREYWFPIGSKVIEKIIGA
jgi:hypothetical protein